MILQTIGNQKISTLYESIDSSFDLVFHEKAILHSKKASSDSRSGGTRSSVINLAKKRSPFFDAI
jgi:hypothetical protein